MPAKKREDGEKAQYDKKYYDEHITRKVLNFNENNPEDEELLEWLESLKKGEMSAYIKRLVRGDMERGKQNDE